MTVRFYWGKTKHMKLTFPALMRTWAASLYGVSIGDAFFGVLIRGDRETSHDR